jgi:hypothetical protein
VGFNAPVDVRPRDVHLGVQLGDEEAGVLEDDAIRNAVSRASQTLRDLDWFEVTNVRGHIEDGAVAHFQVTVKIGFRLE